MSKVTKAERLNPEAETVESEVVAFRAQFESRSTLDQIVQDGAQRMLQAAIEAEVDDFLAEHTGRVDDDGTLGAGETPASG